MANWIPFAVGAGAAAMIKSRSGSAARGRRSPELRRSIQQKYRHLKGHQPLVRYTYFDGRIVYLFGEDGKLIGWGKMKDKVTVPNSKVIDGLGVIEGGLDFTPRVNMAKLRLIGRSARGRRAGPPGYEVDDSGSSFQWKAAWDDDFRAGFAVGKKNAERGKRISASSAYNISQRYGFDGIEIDWEEGYNAATAPNSNTKMVRRAEALGLIKKGRSARGRRALRIPALNRIRYMSQRKQEAERDWAKNMLSSAPRSKPYALRGKPSPAAQRAFDEAKYGEEKKLREYIAALDLSLGKGRSARGRSAKTKSRFAGMDLTAADFRPRTRAGFYKRGHAIVYIAQPQPFPDHPGSGPLRPGDWWVDYVGTLTKVDKSGPTSDTRGIYETQDSSGGMKLHEFTSGGWRRIAPSKLNANWRAFFKRAGINPSKVK